MKRFGPLLLDVWREACRHIEIEESATAIARILASRMPIADLVVIACDWRRGEAAVRAASRPQSWQFRTATRKVSPAQKRALMAWGRTPRAQRDVGSRGLQAVLALLPDASPSGAWLAGPLEHDGELTGALLLGCDHPGGFGTLHRQMLEALLEPFSAALANDRSLRELRALREAAEADKRSALSRLGRTQLCDEIVGADGGLGPVMERVKLVARSDVPVLILGETGTGKELVARTIHEHSRRSGGPFVRVNCGAIAPELIDSELFGHEKGAFTGATASRRGWFERADGGSLLLDEIGELPPPAQVRLLRVLQEGSFERVGGERPVQVDVRTIAATHGDLPEMVQSRRFREDLWYRVSGFPIILPPLRERKQDVPALVAHFALRAAHRFGLRPQQPTAAHVALLCSYDWPGNVRELASVVDRAAILGDGHRLEVSKALGLTPVQPPERPPAAADALAPPVAAGGIAPLAESMRRHIEAALSATGGQVEGRDGAAALLQINPHTLRARMRKLGIDWCRFRSTPAGPRAATRPGR